MLSPSRSALAVLALASTLVAAHRPADASAAVTARAASAKAVSALGVRTGHAPVIVFRQPRVVPAGTAIGQAGEASAARRGRRPGDARLRRAGVTVASAPTVARTGGEPAWLFYEDRAPYQAYQHRGRVVLVGQRTGRVTVTRTLSWPPLVAGRLPVFLDGYRAYRTARYRVFQRSWRLRGAAPAAGARSAGGLLARPLASASAALRAVSGGTPAAPGRADATPAYAPSKQAADALAAEGSCAIRISDTLGSFYDAGPVDRTRAQLGIAFGRLADLNPGFHTSRYRSADGLTPQAYVARQIRRDGCKDVLLYLAGGGYAGGAPAVNVGTRGRADGRVEQQVVTAAALRGVLRAHRTVTFKVLVDAPYSGALLPVLRAEPNLVLFASSSGADQGSFTALSDVRDASGDAVRNAYNARGHLEFTNRQLAGLRCFLSDPDEVAAGVRAKAEGRTRSFLAWMLARSLTLCTDGNLTDLIDGAPRPVIDVDGGIPTGPTRPTPAPGPAGPGNRAPVAVGETLATPEDTAVALALAGTDPDGDRLTSTIVDGPRHGTLSGDAASRVYTPARDFHGRDSFTFTVSDGAATSAPATVAIDVAPVDDAPTVTLGADPTTFAEGGAPVAVDPGLRVADVDDETLDGATLRIGDGHDADVDALLFADTDAIRGAFDAATGELRLTGTAPVAAYEAALRSVRFRTTGPDPSGATRRIAVTVTDGELASEPAVRAVVVATVNDAPVLAGGGTTATYTEDDDAVAVAPAVTVTDPDSPQLARATVRIAAGLVAAEDRLEYAAQDGIAGAYDAQSGTLTLTGAAPLAAYQAALRRVRYRDANGGDPATAARTVSLTVDDGAAQNATSAAETTTVQVVPVNDAPSVAAGGVASRFTEGGAPVPVDPGVTVADVDDAQLRGATVRITGGGTAAEDVLALPATPGLSGAYDAATGTLTVTGTATVAAYQAALRSVTYANANDADPSAARRTLAFRVTDGDAGAAPADAAVDVVPVNDAPVLGGGGTTVTFAEDDADGVVLHPGVTVDDVDSPTLSSATVTIASGLVAAEDRLEVADGDGITGTYDAATGTLTLTGVATQAAYQAALRRVRYRNANTANPSAARRTVQLRVDDGAAASNVSTAIVTNVDVDPVNDAPTVAAGGGSPVFTEGGAPVVVDPGATVADVDDAQLVGATVTIGAGFDPSEDVLAYVADDGITGAYQAGTGVLRLTGTASVAAYQAALRRVTYADADGDDPSGADRTVTFVVDDGTDASAAATTTVRVQPVNDAPVAATTAGATPFVEDGGAVVVDGGVTLSDVDDATLSGATVTLGGGALGLPARGTLAFSGSSAITGVFDPLTGVLTLTGDATVAAYQAALRAVRFDDADDAPDTTPRSVAFRVTDRGGATSAAATKVVTVAPTNDAPRVTAGGTAAEFTEAGDPVAVDAGVTVSDPDDATLTAATVCLCANFVAGEDVLDYDAGDSGITGAYDAATGRLTLTGTASVAAYQAALRRVTYRNTSAEPSTADRTVRTTVSDGSATSAAATATVRVKAVNTAPTLSGGGSTVAYTEDDPPTIVGGGLVVTDPDDTQLDGARVAITSGLVAGEDRLRFTDAAGITGTYDAATGVLALTGKASLAAYQSALRAVRYENVNGTAPATAPRTVAFTVFDGDDTSAAAETTVTVASRPDAPVLTAGTGNVRTFVEGGSPVAVDDALTVADVDSAQLSGATVSITAGFSATEGDQLVFVNQDGITGSYAAGTGVLTLSGDASVATYQSALRSIRFANTSDAPTASRTVTFVARDDTATASAPATHAVTLQGVNDAPTLSGGGALAYTENDAATAVSPALAVADPDSADLAGARVAITGGLHAAEDRLSLTAQGGVTGSYDAATGVLTLSGTASVATYRTVLRSVAYRNLSDAPSADRRTLTYEVTDTGTPGLQATTTATVDVTPVNDAPATVADSDSAVGNTRLVRGVSAPAGEPARTSVQGDVLENDTDVDGPDPLTVDVAGSSTTSAQGGTVTWQADGTFSYLPPAGYTGSDTLTYRASDGEGTSLGTVTVTVSGRVFYVRNTAPGGGTGRSSDPFATLAAADSAANASGDRIFVFRGDGTTSGLTGGVTLQSGQRLLGATQDLQIGGDTLLGGTPSERPSIAGTVALDSGNVVAGLTVTGNAGGAIVGGTGDAGGTLSDLRITGSGGAGISLNGTSGSWDVADTTVQASGGDGIVLTNAGTVRFASAGTITSSTTNGRGLTVTGTALSGTVDAVSVASSPTSGVALTSTTGALTLTDLSLTTTGTGLDLDNASDILVPASGTATITAGGPAVDLSSDAGTPAVPPAVALDSASSSGGAFGVRIANVGAGTFSAPAGTLSGHTTAELSVTGGSGDVSYGGTIGNGSGLSARVDSRTGGTVAVSGDVNDTSDAGGGVAMTGNTGGATRFTGATKTLNTGAQNAVDLSYAGDHEVTFTGGGLDVDTTSGTGLRATTGNARGLLAVTGDGNTITSTAGAALDVDGPDVTSAGLTFASLRSTGAASSGVRLQDTGTAGGLTVTGTPTSSPTVGSGGAVTSSAGPGVALANATGVALAAFDVTGSGDDGLRATNVDGLQLTYGSRITNNGNADDERGVDLTEMSGTVALQGATVTGSHDDNVAVVNDARTLSNLLVQGGTIGTNDATTGEDGIRIENQGTGDTTAAIRGVTFDRNRGDHIQVTTDGSTSATQNVTIQSNTLRGDGNQASPVTVGGGITINPAGSGTTTATVLGNDIERSSASAIVVNAPASATRTVRATVQGNDIGTAGEEGSGSATGDGIYVNGHGASRILALVQNNTVRRFTSSGISVVQNDGAGGVDATVVGNTVAEANANASSGLRVVAGSDVPDTADSCIDLGGAGGLRNLLSGAGVSGPELRMSMRGGPNNTVRLPGYAGGVNDSAAVATYLAGRNGVSAANKVVTSQIDTTQRWVGQSPTCPQP
ncbi:tandem-95 repeat protein [Patulibacter sp. SYSU D01012]|uniref:tandem-95 repeat protein n=1 Tax=Patulibacter sp. SYSU D01012 TaxID=2817381 RepID=UPI001B310E45|nr:tandem-95 repeat protein [Patulibacter sp. SYSU D01012]